MKVDGGGNYLQTFSVYLNMVKKKYSNQNIKPMIYLVCTSRSHSQINKVGKFEPTDKLVAH